MSISSASSRPVGPVDRAFGLLQLVVAATEPVGVRELGRQSGLSPSTASRTLAILVDLGMVERTATGAVRPGPALATLTGNATSTPAAVRARFLPLVNELADTFNENAAVAIDHGGGLLYLASSRLSSAVQVADPAGSTFPFHLVAPGIVAMAAWDHDRLRRYLDHPLDSATEFSITQPAAIERRLHRARSDGFVWTDQELDMEVNGLAVPVHDRAHELVAIATLYGPTYRLSPDLRPDLAREMAAFVTERAGALVEVASSSG